MADGRSTCSTATTCSTRARSRTARAGRRAASFVATKGARGVVVFDGGGDETQRGPLSVRYAPDADTLLERLAAENRARERVVLVSSDATVLGTAGRQVTSVSSQTFFRELRPAEHREDAPADLAGRLDEDTRARLERLRRGEGE
jgi:hypothetical protein